MLIELKDGDTVFVYNPSSGESENTNILCHHLERMAPKESNVRVVIIDGFPFKIEVYRPPTPPEPVDEHDGWFAWDSAPRDGQEIDVWIEPRGRVPEVYFEHGGFFYYDEGEKCALIDRLGTPTHWRYPPKGPKA